MKNIELVPSEKTFINWVNTENSNINLTPEDAGLLLGYIMGHGCGVGLDATDTIVVVDIEDLENGIIARGFEELLERVSSWNYEFLQDSEVVGSHREQILKDAEILDRLMDGCHIGQPLGYPTVKELIAALSNLPEDYRVTCCGAECFVHLFAQDKYITIDSEHHLL